MVRVLRRVRRCGSSRVASSIPVPNRRPKLEIVAPAASPEEAAAVVAAVERFLRDTAPPPAPAEPPPNPWVRAARLEAVERFPDENFRR
ncbi:MAG: hypothetical protein QOH72_532 [Solirubrobacteraceae bacterium]|nr:hypothetical protein [Solirubrobacteraceae bacterium]